MLVDTHCHIYKEYYQNIDEVMDNVSKNNISLVINNACNLKTSLEVLELSKKYENMYIAIGLHPDEISEGVDKIIKLIKENKGNKKLIAIGEIGLDYYHNKDNKLEQQTVLKKQLDLATELNLPVILHSREATGDMINILKSYKLKGIIHCFNGSVETAKEYIKLGYKLGINGVITFKNCKLISVLKKIGLDNIVFETDSPYLTPTPFRGEQNNPSYINNIANFICDNLNISLDKLETITNQNVSEIFDINI